MAARQKRIYYIVESIDWAPTWEAKYTAENIRKLYNIPIKIMRTSRLRLSLIRNSIIHFGSRSTYLPANHKYIHCSNSTILTWYHGTDKDVDYIRLLPEVSKKLSFIHTSTTVTEKQLVKWGADPDKIRVIPIGIDTNQFIKVDEEKKKRLKHDIGIPYDSVCIGSFQKDGNGWGEGNTPKMVKGPDIFCNVVEMLKKDFPIFILLTGPARGYVKNRLAEAGIPYKHIFLKNYLDIPKYYNALDLYIISSRAEGGPKSMHESFASGVPLVSTDMGMVRDYGKSGYNSLISPIDDAASLAENCKRVIADKDLREKLVKGGLETVKQLDWKVIARKYFEEIYSKLL